MSTPESTPVSPITFASLATYEKWVGTNWIHPKGTIEAQEHTRKKLAEETEELIDALINGTPDEILKEAGDVLWTATATASNTDISSTEGFPLWFPEYFKGDTPITASDIDWVAATILQDVETLHLIEYLREDEHALGKKVPQWFTEWQHITDPVELFSNALASQARRQAVDALTRTTLLISYIAQEYAGKNLDAVLQTNYQKLEQRLRDGRAVTSLPN